MTTRLFLLALAGLVAWTTPAPAAPAPVQNPWQAVDTALGRPGTDLAGGVRRYGFPRWDLAVTLDRVQINPALALGSWVAFRRMGAQAEVMGDLVLTHDEVNPVLDRLLASGLAVTALHNHLLRSTPATMYMHIMGHGDAAALARSVRAALETTHTPLGPPPILPTTVDPLDSAALDRLLGATGKEAGLVRQYSFPRADVIREGGVPVPATMGLATAINFQPTGRGRVAVTGDFVLTAGEIAPVMQALRQSGIEVTALHNHMTNEQPRLFFMHFWANADAAALARGLRQALDHMAVARAPR